MRCRGARAPKYLPYRSRKKGKIRYFPTWGRGGAPKQLAKSNFFLTLLLESCKTSMINWIRTMKSCISKTFLRRTRPVSNSSQCWVFKLNFHALLMILLGLGFHIWDYVTDWDVLEIFTCQFYRNTGQTALEFITSCNITPISNDGWSILAHTEWTPIQNYGVFMADFNDQIGWAVVFMFAIFVFSLIPVVPILPIALYSQYRVVSALRDPLIESGDKDIPTSNGMLDCFFNKKHINGNSRSNLVMFRNLLAMTESGSESALQFAIQASCYLSVAWLTTWVNDKNNFYDDQDESPLKASRLWMSVLTSILSFCWAQFKTRETMNEVSSNASSKLLYLFAALLNTLTSFLILIAFVTAALDFNANVSHYHVFNGGITGKEDDIAFLAIVLIATGIIWIPIYVRGSSLPTSHIYPDICCVSSPQLNHQLIKQFSYMGMVSIASGVLNISNFTWVYRYVGNFIFILGQRLANQTDSLTGK